MKKQTILLLASLLFILTLTATTLRADAKTTYLYEPVVGNVESSTSEVIEPTDTPDKAEVEKEKDATKEETKEKTIPKKAKTSSTKKASTVLEGESLKEELISEDVETAEDYLADIRCMTFAVLMTVAVGAGVLLAGNFGKGVK